MKFPVDARKEDVIRAFKRLGFIVVREENHIIMERVNADFSKTPLVLHPRTIKSSTLRTVITEASIERQEFIDAYSKK